MKVDSRDRSGPLENKNEGTGPGLLFFVIKVGALFDIENWHMHYFD